MIFNFLFIFHKDIYQLNLFYTKYYIEKKTFFKSFKHLNFIKIEKLDII